MSDSPQSPPKDVEQGAPSPTDEDAQMDNPQDPHSAGLAYEFEVKEQDRWLPIANGTWCFLLLDSLDSCAPVVSLLWEHRACVANERLPPPFPSVRSGRDRVWFALSEAP